MIEFKETFHFDGITVVSLVADGMPERCDARDYKYKITVFPEGKAISKSRASGNGSVRYHHFRTYEEAQEHAVKWAKRQIALERHLAERRAANAVEFLKHREALAA
jgi:hypothetical protein